MYVFVIKFFFKCERDLFNIIFFAKKYLNKTRQQ